MNTFNYNLRIFFYIRYLLLKSKISNLFLNNVKPNTERNIYVSKQHDFLSQE